MKRRRKLVDGERHVRNIKREIMDAINDPFVEDIVIMASAQVGKSEIILNALGYYIHYDPSPILLIQPVLDKAKDFRKNV